VAVPAVQVIKVAKASAVLITVRWADPAVTALSVAGVALGAMVVRQASPLEAVSMETVVPGGMVARAARAEWPVSVGWTG
jgi:hypothetical protein